jgi:hypothetical protein
MMTISAGPTSAVISPAPRRGAELDRHVAELEIRHRRRV